MRPNAPVVLAMFVFMSPCLVTYAEAQRHGTGGGAPGGAPYLRAGAANFDARTTLSTGLAIDRIERALRLTNEQDTALKGLEDASTRAAGLMKANCQPDQTLTPTGRVGLMDDRLSAMLKALDTVQSVLVNFYDSLSDEQKARFNRLGVEG